LAYGAVVDDTSLLDILTTEFNVLDPNARESRVDPDELEWLLNNGIRVGGTLEDLTTILHFAIQRGMSLPVVEVLVGAGADLHAVNLDGVTPLMLARAQDRNDVTDYLEEQGATESDLPGYEQAIVDDNVAALASYLDQGMSPPPFSPMYSAQIRSSRTFLQKQIPRGKNYIYRCWKSFKTYLRRLV
jgi:ankyrin repeat protein